MLTIKCERDRLIRAADSIRNFMSEEGYTAVRDTLASAEQSQRALMDHPRPYEITHGQYIAASATAKALADSQQLFKQIIEEAKKVERS